MDLRYLRTESLRRVIGVAPQRIDLFGGSVIANIAVGELEPDIKKVLAVCSELGMHSFIDSLPEGFQTDIGENGATLSGGQRQRLAIARALTRDPELLILDEATASIDSATEQHILRSIENLRPKGNTILMI